jgi:chemotaxis protein methyltransferase CheR
VFPARLRARASQQSAGKTLRLLSAGCSSGEEAYSMAVVARETLAPPATVVIRAVDVNPEALERARRRRYSSWALRETPRDIQAKWFHQHGRDMVLDDAIRDMVTFEAANLANDDPRLWQPACYDVIFCRNVLMYFEPQQMRAVIARITQSLAPGGFLFLGHAETLRGVSEAFHLCNSHGTFYHQLKDGAQRDQVPGDQVIRQPTWPVLTEVPYFAQDVAWFDAIRQASERVAALLPSTDSARDVRACPTPSAPRFDPAPTLELLRQERFADALDRLRAGAKPGEANADVLLLEAALLVHSGQLEAAEAVASRLLLINGCSEAAHYVLALCFEYAGKVDRASEHHRTAARFDPSFAMPRLHLGLLARRSGARAAAAREFAQALALLEHEEPSRLLLFGGGFSREALMSLCESALRDCGGRA